MLQRQRERNEHRFSKQGPTNKNIEGLLKGCLSDLAEELASLFRSVR